MPNKGKLMPIYKNKDLTGKTFGHLTIIAPTDKRTKDKKRMWLAQCSCGNKTLVPGRNLKDAGRKSHCGCQKFIGPSHKNWKGHGNICGQYWSNLRYTAKQRGLPFMITIEQAWSLFLEQENKCALSGVQITLGSINVPREERYKQKTASIDRINSSIGYTPENIQWVHKEINYIKNKLGNERFIFWCKKIAEHHSHQQD